jgi:ABC-type dipeptide/oligopeptide/nickel transport system permease subunit
MIRPDSPSSAKDALVGPGELSLGSPVGAATLPPVILDAGDLPVQPLPGWRLAFSTFAENRLALVSLIGLILIILFCYVGPLIYHTNQVAANLLLASQHPSAAHLLGTTPEGRDELGALMLGGQSTIEVGLAVAVIATAFGLVYGLVAGYFGGILDAILMRIVDAVLAIPFFFFVVLLASLVTPTLWLIILVITSASWLSTARLVRAEALSLRTRDYVKAAEGYGSRRQRILFRHITPNLLGVVIVNATLKVADAILAFATISYLGLGIPPPHTDWGLLLTDGINNLFNGYWWQLWPPAFLIVVTVLAASVLGDGLRDVAEGRLQRR